MPSLTQYFGLQRLSGGEDFGTNGWKFTDEDRVIVDRLLYLALSGHTHDGAVAGGVGAPAVPTLVQDTTSGSLPAATRIYYRITLVDADGNESVASPEAYVDTPNAITEPAAPAPRYVTSGGTLLAGGYSYACSAYTTTNTLETRALNAGSLTIPTGSTNSITLEMPGVPAGATGFNIYRRKPGASQFVYLASVVAATTSYTDNGSVTEDVNRGLPVTNTTNSANRVAVYYPGATPVIPTGHSWKVYRTMVSGQYTNSLLHWVVETTVEAGSIVVTSFIDIGQGTTTGRPPDVSQVPGSPAKVLLTDGSAVQGRLPMSQVSAFPYVVTLPIAGTITASGPQYVWVCPFPQATIISSRISLGTASTLPSTDNMKVDINKGPSSATPTFTTIYSTQGNRPQILKGQRVGAASPTPNTTELLLGDALSPDVDVVGGGSPSNLVIEILLYVYGWTSTTSHPWA